MKEDIALPWELSSAGDQTESTDQTSTTATTQGLLLATCRDCGNSHHPPQFYCCYCGSTRVQPVLMPTDAQPHPATWIFRVHRPHPKPN